MVSIEEYTKRLTDSLRLVKHSHVSENIEVVSSTEEPAEFAREYEAFWTDEEEDEEEAE